MAMLPEVNNEEMPKFHRVRQVIATNRKLKIGLAVAMVIIILGIVAIVSTYSSITTKVESNLRDEYAEQIVDLENQLKRNEEKYEKELNEQKESYEKKLANKDEKHTEELAKKDEKIAEQEIMIHQLEVENQISFDEIETDIKAVGKLTTIDYHYTYAGTHEETKDFFGIKLPWTENRFIAQWGGVVALGVDLSKVSIYVDDTNKVITVSMPRAEIFYHDVDESSFEVLDEKNNIFNPISVVDKIEFDKKYENKIYEKIEEIRLLNDAYENAQVMIENIFSSVPQITTQYTINYKQIQ